MQCLTEKLHLFVFLHNHLHYISTLNLYCTKNSTLIKNGSRFIIYHHHLSLHITLLELLFLKISYISILFDPIHFLSSCLRSFPIFHITDTIQILLFELGTHFHFQLSFHLDIQYFQLDDFHKIYLLVSH